MLESVIKRTQQFIAAASKEDRKRYGQFFTSEKTARYMAQLFQFDYSRPEISILDPGAGTGILSAAVIERMMKEGYKGQITIACYESDLKVMPVLMENMRAICTGTNVRYLVFPHNFITSQPFENDDYSANGYRFDYVIGNPPYLKISKDSPEVKHMPSVCHGAPNLYFLFWAMAIHNLRDGGELVFIVPRSWTSGAYFGRFRKYLFHNVVLKNIHLFISRDKVFNEESVLQETIIVRVKKGIIKPKNICISSCSTADFSDLTRFAVPYNTVVARNGYVFLPTNKEEVDVLSRVNGFTDTLQTIHSPMHTGLVVDYRSRDLLKDVETPETCPLFYSGHLRDGEVVWPIGKSGEHIKIQKGGLVQPNENYIFVKRFTSKEEPRRLQCAVYLSSQYPSYKYISTQNKINFIRCQSLDMLFGLYALLNSTLYDQYYRILNGSTQVNSTEINSMPIPSASVICSIGRELHGKPLSTLNCNKIISKWI